MDSLAADRALISSLGGVTKLAERLHTSVQVVSNWNRRGIPAKVKLAHPEMFLRELSRPARKVVTQQQQQPQPKPDTSSIDNTSK